MLERLRRAGSGTTSRGSSGAVGRGRATPAVVVTHFADPFCWWSWGLEPALHRLKALYGDQLRVDYRMGGVFTDIAEWRKDYGVNEETTVAWTRESADATGNPVDVDYMRKTGVRSTHPACLAYKAAQLQDPDRADEFFRRMLVAFQVECQPATDATLLHLATEVGLDAVRLGADVRSEQVRRAFEDDMAEMQRAHASFLTLVVEAGGHHEVVRQVFTSGPIEQVIDRLIPRLSKSDPPRVEEYLRGHPGWNTARETAEVLGVTDAEAISRLTALEGTGAATRSEFSGSSFWRTGGP
jgi:putative protein-disulfide isomerase